MSSHLLAVRPGPLITVQDLGRPGFQRFGVAEGGVMDRRAHCLGAALLGQPPALASLEMTSTGGIFRAGPEPVHVVVTGAPMSLEVEGYNHPAGHTVRIAPDTEFEIGATTTAVYGYLSVSGGVDTEPVIGSRSTHLRAGLGGVNGRNIQAGDLIPVGPDASTVALGVTLPTTSDTETFRFVWGLHADAFAANARAMLKEEAFEITALRDRMGMGLKAPRPLRAPLSLSLPSSPVVDGDIQVPGDGHPVILLADRQPTGGYPRIATIIQADRDRFAQQPTGTLVRFAEVSLDKATDLLFEYRRELAELVTSAGGSTEPALRALWQQNLISGFTAGGQEAD